MGGASWYVPAVVAALMIVGVLVSKFADDMEQTGRTGQQRRLSCRLPTALNDCVRGFREFSRSVVSAMLCILSDA